MVGMGWVDGERLLSVLEDGFAKIYSLSGECIGKLSFGTTDTAVMECRVWQGGVVLLLSDLSFLVLSNLEDPRPRRYPSANLTTLPHDWCLIPPAKALSLQVEVLIANEQTVLNLDGKECREYASAIMMM